MLVKSFRDDLAWQVQDALLSHYFHSKEQGPTLDELISDPETALLAIGKMNKTLAASSQKLIDGRDRRYLPESEKAETEGYSKPPSSKNPASAPSSSTPIHLKTNDSRSRSAIPL